MNIKTSLSPRETDVLELLLEGKSNKQIALALGITERTVEFHLKNLFEKVGVSSRVELILTLGKSTGIFPVKPVESTVDTEPQNVDNGNQTDSQFFEENSQGKLDPSSKTEFAMTTKYLPFLPPVVIILGLALIAGGIITEKYGAVVIGIICAGVASHYWITHFNDQKAE